MKISRRVAFCGVLCTLATLWLIATAFPYATLAFSALAGLMLAPASLELGSKYGFLCYVATSLLSWLLVPDVSAKLTFTAFFGFYPILQLRINLWQNRLSQWSVKLAIFNGMCILSAVVMWLVFDESIGKPLLIALPFVFLAGNAAFILYDIALWRMIGLYRRRLHPLVTVWLR